MNEKHCRLVAQLWQRRRHHRLYERSDELTIKRVGPFAGWPESVLPEQAGQESHNLGGFTPALPSLQLRSDIEV